MPSYNIEDILAVRVDQKVLCSDCMSEGNWDSIESESDIITDTDSDEVIVFCDECKKRIS
jgi:hypothetical protein